MEGVHDSVGIRWRGIRWRREEGLEISDKGTSCRISGVSDSIIFVERKENVAKATEGEEENLEEITD